MIATHLDSRVVLFDSITCCALRQAYHDQRNSDFLFALGEVLGEIRLVDVFGGIFDRATRLGFIPNREASIFHGKLARHEAELIEVSDEVLPCGHTKAQHCIALEYVSIKFPSDPAN